MTQPHIPSQPQPCRSLSRQPNLRQGTASSRWPLLSHESRRWLPTSGGFH